jgi:RNA polymerase sigma factor (sigma-70 family)
MITPMDHRSDPASPGETTLLVRRAIGGDLRSVEWIVTHFTPFLLAQARYRLSKHLQSLYDPEDLVQRAWAITIPRLATIEPRGGRYTPVLMRFLSSVVYQDYRNLLQKHLGKPVELQAEKSEDDRSGTPAGQLAADSLAVSARAVRSERVAALRAAIERLSPEDREVLILHGIEELPFKVISAKIGVNESTLRSRYRKALGELKKEFPPSMIEELEAED